MKIIKVIWLFIKKTRNEAADPLVNKDDLIQPFVETLSKLIHDYIY